MYAFLVWNIFLAGLPYVFSSAVQVLLARGRSKYLVGLFALLWLAFFPNALYVITDFIHLRVRGNVPIWYDLVLVFSFAWSSVVVGFISLRTLQNIIVEKYGILLGWVFAVVSIGLASFGIYLGRFLRWNSWDIISRPGHLFLDVLDRIFNPLSHPRTYAFSVLLWLFFVITYATVISMERDEASHVSNIHS